MIAVAQTVKGYKDDYRIEALLGEERSARMFRAVRVRDEEEVVLEELALGPGVDKKSLELLEREASALESLSHPHVAKLHEVFSWDGERARDASTALEERDSSRLVVVQQCLRGQSLAQRLANAERLDARALERLLRGALSILRDLHGQNPPLVHGGIHPDRVVLNDDGQPSLRSVGPYLEHVRRCCTGTIALSRLGYMPVEQAFGVVRPSADLYSLGLTVLAAATLTQASALPIDADVGKVDFSRLKPALDARLRKVLSRMIEPLAKSRIASAEDALVLLDGRSPARPLLAGGAVLALGAAASLLVRARDSEPESARGSGQVTAAAGVTTAAERGRSLYVGHSYEAVIDGDGVTDILAHDFQDNVFAISGATGLVLWERMIKGDRFVGSGALLASTAFDVAAYDLATGVDRWKLRLSDRLDRAAFGAGCTVLTSADKLNVSVDVTTGKPTTSCELGRANSATRRAAADGGVVAVGPYDLTFEEVGAGTPQLAVSRRAGRKVLWATTLDVRGFESNNPPPAVIANGNIFVVADDCKNPEHATHVIRLDPETGATLAASYFPNGSVSFNPPVYVLSQQIVALELRGKLVAIDTVTLAERWQVGSN